MVIMLASTGYVHYPNPTGKVVKLRQIHLQNHDSHQVSSRVQGFLRMALVTPLKASEDWIPVATKSMTFHHVLSVAVATPQHGIHQVM